MTGGPTATLPWVPPRAEFATEAEKAAAEWIAPYGQAWHLLRTRDWLMHLDPAATVEMRLAAMTHDIERMFPGGPRVDFTVASWDDPVYLYAHQLRSAEIVGVWLAGREARAEGVDAAEVRRLVALHEVGGLRGADLVQAADSLSFLETLAGLARDWVTSGTCTRAVAAAKLRYSVDRIRVPEAVEPARALFDWAVAQLPPEEEEDA